MCLQGKDSNEEERGLGIDFIHKSNKKKKEVSLWCYIFHTWWWRD